MTQMINYTVGNITMYLQIISLFHSGMARIGIPYWKPRSKSTNSRFISIFVKHEMHRTYFTHKYWFTLLHTNCCVHHYSQDKNFWCNHKNTDDIGTAANVDSFDVRGSIFKHCLILIIWKEDNFSMLFFRHGLSHQTRLKYLSKIYTLFALCYILVKQQSTLLISFRVTLLPLRQSYRWLNAKL